MNFLEFKTGYNVYHVKSLEADDSVYNTKFLLFRDPQQSFKVSDMAAFFH